MWRHSLIALLLGHAITAVAWLFIYGPLNRTDPSEESRMSAAIFAAAILMALGLFVIAAVGSGLAMARDEASQTNAGFLVLAGSGVSLFGIFVVGCYHLLG